MSDLVRLLQHSRSAAGRYHEPFVGGGALFFEMARLGKLENGAVLSDVNPKLVRAYRGIRDDVDQVVELIQQHVQRHGIEHYIDQRARDIERGTDADVAAWMVYMNRAGFNGLYRENSDGWPNVPMGDGDPSTFLREDELRASSAALQGVDLVCGPYSEVLLRAQRGDSVYLDPPYDGGFTRYVKDGFTSVDQRALAECARALGRMGVRVVVSNADTEFVRSIYRGFDLVELEVQRSVAAAGDRRQRAAELLIVGRSAA